VNARLACGLLSLTCLLGCRAYGALAWTHQADSGLVEATETVRVPFECPRAASWVAVHFAHEVESGTVEAVVFDPAGVERHRGTWQAGRHEQDLEYPAQAGRWIVELAVSRLTGAYGVSLHSGRSD